MLRAWAKAPDAALPSEAPASDSQDAKAPLTQEQLAFAALEKARYARLEQLKSAASTSSAFIEAGGGATVVMPAKFEPIWGEIEHLSRFTARRLTPAPIRRRARVRLALALAALLVVAAVFALRVKNRPWVVASGTFSVNHPAAYAVDGSEGTEWLLPETTPGWIDLTFKSPRKVREVRLLNAHNQYNMDRASQNVRVTAYSEQGALASAEGAFAKLTDERSALDLKLNASGVTRLRVEVLSFFSRGGGLAEVEVR
jgi:hypothetical protein